MQLAVLIGMGEHELDIQVLRCISIEDSKCNITYLAFAFLMAFLALTFLTDWPGKGEVPGNLNEIVHKK